MYKGYNTYKDCFVVLYKLIISIKQKKGKIAKHFVKVLDVFFLLIVLRILSVRLEQNWMIREMYLKKRLDYFYFFDIQRLISKKNY